jgi:hypothetical protein
MNIKLTQFQVKYDHDGKWHQISERRLLGRLAESFTKITPELSKMFNGEEIITRNEIFRVKK